MASPSAWSVVPEGSASQWTPVKEDTATPDKPSLASDFARYSPIGMVQSIANGIRHPIDTARSLANMPAENAKLLDKAKDSFDKGNYGEAAIHFLNYVNPVGSAMEDAGADFQHGDYAHGLAKTAGLATSMVASAKAPQIMDKLTDIPQAVSNAVQRGVDAVDAATSPAVVRKAVTVLPKGQTALDAYDAFQAERARLQAARAPSTARFSRDANSPAWSAFPDSEKPPPAPPITPATALPSGRVPGGAAHGASLQAKVAAVAQAAANEAADPVLNAVAQMQGHADFSAAPAEAQVGIRAAASKIPAEMTPEQVAAFTGEPPSAPQPAPTTAQAPTPVTAPPVQPLGARPATAPVAAQAAQSSAPAGLSIAEQLRDEMLRNGTIQPSQVVGAPQAAASAVQSEAKSALPPVQEKFVRFGKPPEGGRSLNGATGELENGVSTYRLVKHNGEWHLDGTAETLPYAPGTGDRSVLYEVKGSRLPENGADNEPLLSNVSGFKKYKGTAISELPSTVSPQVLEGSVRIPMSHVLVDKTTGLISLRHPDFRDWSHYWDSPENMVSSIRKSTWANAYPDRASTLVNKIQDAFSAAPVSPTETNLQDLMRNPASSTARAPEWIRQKEMASSEPKAVADGLYAEGKQTPEQAGAVYQAAARADKAVKLAQALHSGGITYADALKLEPEHWADIAKSLGVNKPSKTSIGEALFRLQRLEAAAKPPVGGIQ